MNEELPKHFIEVYLRPGDFYWGRGATRIQTLLGSCVSLTFWHPGLKQGGMCHFMLPADSSLRSTDDEKNEARYGAGAMRLFMERIQRLRTTADEYEIKMFGGGNMFPTSTGNAGDPLIGENNIAFARRYLSDLNLKIVSEDVGGACHRKIFFDVWTGHVWLKRATSFYPTQGADRSA